MHEFALIARCFAPLAKDYPGSLGLKDDAALVNVPEGMTLVATTDAIVAGVHFMGNEDAALIARKLLRVNLSDLAAMGAAPHAYLLTVMLPRGTPPAWVERFAAGLAEDQKAYGIRLIGGDTVTIDGPASFSLTALGTVPKGRTLLRSGARPGDLLCVSGTLGDSALGLKLLQKKLDITLSDEHKNFLKNRYLLPEPRIALGAALRGLATACMDVSDGLVQDLGHLCTASGTGAAIEAQKLPLSLAARALIKADPALLQDVLSSGDDYELLFTLPPGKRKVMESISEKTGVPLAVIGEMTAGKDVHVLDENKSVIQLKRKGFQHF